MLVLSFSILCYLVCFAGFYAQSIADRLQIAVKKFEASPQGKVAQIGYSIRDASGKVVAEYQSHKGFAPASSLKLFTAAYALDNLGKDFEQKTHIAYTGKIINNILDGNLIIHSEGDPTLGSWRYAGKKPEDFLAAIYLSLKKIGVNEINGAIICDESYYDLQSVPGGWPADDIGNYYGAGVWGLNWRENQFDVNFENGKILSTTPDMPYLSWENYVSASPSQKTDESIIYSYPLGRNIFVHGKIPSKKTTVSGSLPHPAYQLANEVHQYLIQQNVKIVTAPTTIALEKNRIKANQSETIILSWISPKLAETIPFFLKRSINLYGESYLKSVAKRVNKPTDFKNASWEMQNYWVKNWIPSQEIFFIDGSGLSPQNFISPNAFTLMLSQIKTKEWFPIFKSGLNVYHDTMKLKSGTIKNAKAYCGYILSNNGTEYSVAVLINNYTGEKAGEQILEMLKNIK